MPRPLQAAADRFVLPMAAEVLRAVHAARRAVSLADLEAALRRGDPGSAISATEAGAAAFAASLLGTPTKAPKKTRGVEPIMMSALRAGGNADELCVLDKDRVARAKLAANPARKNWQDHGEANELRVAKMVKGVGLDDNEPMDVITMLDDKVHGIEVKTFVDNKASKVTMSKSALKNKTRWRRENKATMHTVIVDDRDQFTPDLYSGHRLYYKRGVGSFRLSTAIKVKDAKHLRELMLSKKR